jgi:hypothetical protein
MGNSRPTTWQPHFTPPALLLHRQAARRSGPPLSGTAVVEGLRFSTTPNQNLCDSIAEHI